MTDNPDHPTTDDERIAMARPTDDRPIRYGSVDAAQALSIRELEAENASITQEAHARRIAEARVRELEAAIREHGERCPTGNCYHQQTRDDIRAGDARIQRDTEAVGDDLCLLGKLDRQRQTIALLRNQLRYAEEDVDRLRRYKYDPAEGCDPGPSERDDSPAEWGNR